MVMNSAIDIDLNLQSLSRAVEFPRVNHSAQPLPEADDSRSCRGSRPAGKWPVYSSQLPACRCTDRPAPHNERTSRKVRATLPRIAIKHSVTLISQSLANREAT